MAPLFKFVCMKKDTMMDGVGKVHKEQCMQLQGNSPGVDSSQHAQTNMSVRKGNI